MTSKNIVGKKLRAQSLQNDKQQIMAQYEIQNSQKPKLNEFKVVVKDIRPSSYQRTQRLEAGMELCDSDRIQIIRNNRLTEQHKKSPFDIMINARIKQDDEFKTISNETQQFYNEALRLTKKPELYLKCKQNPINNFVPVSDNKDAKYTRGWSQFIDIPAFKNFDKKKSSTSILIKQSFNNLESPVKNQQLDDSLFIAKPIQQTSKKSIINADQLQNSIIINDNKQVKGHRKTQSLLQLNDNTQKKNFQATFKPENIYNYKLKLSKQQKNTDPYAPVSDIKFRDEPDLHGKPNFQLANKIVYDKEQFGDLRPKFMLDQIEKKNIIKKESIEPKQFVKFFRKAPSKIYNFIDHKLPQMLEKEKYIDPLVLAKNFLKTEAEFKLEFNTTFRPLNSKDKKFLGLQLKV